MAHGESCWSSGRQAACIHHWDLMRITPCGCHILRITPLWLSYPLLWHAASWHPNGLRMYHCVQSCSATNCEPSDGLVMTVSSLGDFQKKSLEEAIHAARPGTAGAWPRLCVH
jgi:hypothetical protein